MNKFIIISLIVAGLGAALVLFRIEARQKRTSVLRPSSYKFGLLGMVVYLVMYGVLTVIEKLCFGIGRVEVLPEPDETEVLTNPMYANAPGNIYNDDPEAGP